MQKKFIFIVLILFLVLFNRCSTINKRAVHRDIAQLLVKNGVTQGELECNASNSSRWGKCIWNNSPEAFDTLIQTLNLQDIQSLAKDVETEFEKMEEPDYELQQPQLFREKQKYFGYWDSYIRERKEYYDNPNTCDYVEIFRDLKLTKIYGNLDSLSETVLENGGAFTNFFLYHRSDINKACIQIIYAYG